MIILKNNNKAFTLIEILVSLTILSVIMVSVLFIFINSTSLTAKSDINRVMQENIKNVVETISEDIRINGIQGVSKNSLDSCNFAYEGSNNFKKGTKLCTEASNVYFLAKEVGGSVVRIDDITLCEGIGDDCFIVKNGDRVTNSSVSVKDIKFTITNEHVPKVTMGIVLQPAARKGVKTNLIKENKIILQTTISEKIF